MRILGYEITKGKDYDKIVDKRVREVVGETIPKLEEQNRTLAIDAVRHGREFPSLEGLKAALDERDQKMYDAGRKALAQQILQAGEVTIDEVVFRKVDESAKEETPIAPAKKTRNKKSKIGTLDANKFPVE